MGTSGRNLQTLPFTTMESLQLSPLPMENLSWKLAQLMPKTFQKWTPTEKYISAQFTYDSYHNNDM